VLADHCKNASEKKRVQKKVKDYEDALQTLYERFATRCYELGIDMR